MLEPFHFKGKESSLRRLPNVLRFVNQLSLVVVIGRTYSLNIIRLATHVCPLLNIHLN